MLETIYLTKSKIRGKLLGILFSNPEEKYYLSELARMTNTSPGNVQREVKRFVSDGLIRLERKGNLVFYVLNRAHALYPEIESLVVKTLGVEGELRGVVEKDKKIQLAVLYGSFSKGKERGESDIDLLVVAEGKTEHFYGKISDLEKRFNREINPVIYSKEEFKRKIKEKDSFITNVLREEHRVLKGSLNEYEK